MSDIKARIVKDKIKNEYWIQVGSDDKWEIHHAYPIGTYKEAFAAIPDSIKAFREYKEAQKNHFNTYYEVIDGE